jgi:hypothetical protein
LLRWVAGHPVQLIKRTQERVPEVGRRRSGDGRSLEHDLVGTRRLTAAPVQQDAEPNLA